MRIPGTATRRFQLILIKPSHYGDDGYVIRWWRAVTPSNSLAAVYGIAADSAARQVLGTGVAIDIAAIDETNTRVDVPELIERNSPPTRVRHGGIGRRPVQSIPQSIGYRTTVSSGGDIRRYGWLPCIRLPFDAGR